MKKIISLFLLMLSTLFFIFPFKVDAATLTSGKCGSNITWKLNDSGTLTLSGSGKMKEYYSTNDFPWYEYSSKIQKVSFSDEITTVAEHAFNSYQNLKEVSLGKNITSIGSFAFFNCNSLTKINLPNKLTSIGNGTFHSTKLSTIVLPDSLVTIGADAFSCTNLKEISIPGITVIEQGTFSECKFLRKIEIASGTKTINAAAFERCEELSEVTLPNSITNISMWAFADCYSLTSLKLPSNLKNLGANVFNGSGLKTITIPKSVTDITTAFNKCSSLTKIYFEGDYLKTLDDYTFDGVTATVYYPKGNSTWIKSRRLDYGGDLTWVAKDYFEITTQPKGKAVKSGEKVSTKVTATGTGLKYQWYIKNPGASKFSKSSITSSTYSCTMKSSISGRKVYCVITNSKGNTLKTNTVTLSMINLKTQPANKRASLGSIVKTSFSASGSGLTYQWYVKEAGAAKFVKSSNTSKSYSYTMTKVKSGRQVYCVIKDKYGNTMQTRTATLSAAASITKQPTNVSAANGKTAKTSITAFGTKLSYQWYICNAGSTKFSKSSVTTSTYSCKMNSKSNGRKVYCIVTDGYGNTVKSKTVTLKLK